MIPENRARTETLYALLKDIFFLLEDGDRRFFSQFDLTTPRFYALKHIGENPGISISQLSTLMLSDKGNISRIVRGMEAEGLVIRRPDRFDGRALCLFLSDEGEALRRETVLSHAAFNHARISGIDTEYEQLLEILSDVKTTLDKHLQDDAPSGGIA
jgi:DNA-binding MarR family transcriptional regulator